MSQRPDDIESEASNIMFDAYYPNVVIVPTKEGMAVIGPFHDATEAWVWIDFYRDYLPEGVRTISPLPPNEAMDSLFNQDLL